MAGLPFAQNLTLKELYAIFSQGRLQKTSLRELEEKGWLDIIKLGVILGLDSDGDLVWIPQDTTGRAPVVEENSAAILAKILKVASLDLEKEGTSAGRTVLITSSEFCQVLQIHNTHGADSGKAIIQNADAALDYAGAGANVVYYGSTLGADASTVNPLGDKILKGPLWITASAGNMVFRIQKFT